MGRLLDRDYGARLLIRDMSPDVRARREIIAAVQDRPGPQAPPPDNSPMTIAALIAQVADTDSAISTQLHAVVLGLLPSRTSIMLSEHHRQNESMAGGFSVSDHVAPCGARRALIGAPAAAYAPAWESGPAWRRR